MSATHKQSTRDGFGEAMLELGQANTNVVALSADLSTSLRLDAFKKQFPDRFVECGIAEQHMMSLGAGLALGGKVPFIASFAVFNPGRNLDQLRVATYSELPIKVVGGYGGFGNGGDGATQQAFEDLAIMCSLPKMTVCVPADGKQAKELTHQIAALPGPCYLRLGGVEVPDIAHFVTTPPTEIGKAQLLTKGDDVSIFTCGTQVSLALEAQKALQAIGMSIEVINMHTLKPFDQQAVIASAQKTRAVFVICEHDDESGLASLISQTLMRAMGEKITSPIAFASIGMHSFGESGKIQDLFDKYHFNQEGIIEHIKLLLQKKKNNK